MRNTFRRRRAGDARGVRGDREVFRSAFGAVEPLPARSLQRLHARSHNADRLPCGEGEEAVALTCEYNAPLRCLSFPRCPTKPPRRSALLQYWLGAQSARNAPSAGPELRAAARRCGPQEDAGRSHAVRSGVRQSIAAAVLTLASGRAACAGSIGQWDGTWFRPVEQNRARFRNGPGRQSRRLHHQGLHADCDPIGCGHKQQNLAGYRS